MNISIESDTIYNITCDFTLDEKTAFKGNFKQVLYHIDRTATTPPSSARQKMQLKNIID